MRAMWKISGLLMVLASVPAMADSYNNNGTPPSVESPQPRTGVGVVLGSPNGLTVRHWIDDHSSIEGAMGWNISGGRFQMNANYLYSLPAAFQIGGENFDVFFGGGLSFRTKSGTNDREVVFGPRLPAGVAYEFTDPNIELFAQAAINIGIIPSSNVYADVNVGVRFYF